MSDQSASHYEQGKLCYQNKKFQEAIFQFSEAIRLKPATPQAAARCYNARGVVYFYLGEFKKVIKDCTKALELDPNNANYHNCRGNAYFSLGKFHKAADDFSKAIELSPEASHGRYYNNRGSAYRRLKMFKEAIEDYTAAIAVDPKNGNYYNNRGNTYFDMGEFQLAIDDFTTALGLEPYSPKTRLTLAQAHEALAQEKRMKNSTQFTGVFSSIKSVSHGSKVQSVRKERQAGIYVSPAGVEVTFTRGWRKKKCQQSFQWSEEMKIELIDDTHVKLFLDGSKNTWVVITPCEAANVEEELIGRITTKYASYSTACLVAQHEGVVNEYTEIVRNIKAAQEQLNLLQNIVVEAQKQKEQYAKQEKFDLADKAKGQVAKLEEQIKQKKSFIESETTRAEQVRSKAEAESGPVLDMVQIMQQRVQELFHTRVKSVKDKYKVDDLELEEQLAKMSALVQRAKELQGVVARPMNDVRKALDVVKADESDDEEEEQDKNWAAFDKNEETPSEASSATPAPAAPAEATPAPAPAPSAPAPEPAPAPAVASAEEGDDPEEDVESEPRAQAAAAGEAKDDESDISDWDIDDGALPEAFAPLEGAEVFMTVDPNSGMVTITPSKSSRDLLTPASDMVVVRKTTIAAYAEAQKEKESMLTELEQKAKLADAAMQEKILLESEVEAKSKSLTAINSELEELRRRAEEAEAALSDKAATEEQVSTTNASLSTIRAEMLLLKEQQAAAEAQLAEKDALVSNLQQTTESLAAMKAEAERVKQQLADKLAELEISKSQVGLELDQTAKEKQELKERMDSQNHAIEELKAHLAHVNKDLSSAAHDALEKSARLKELEQHEVVMAQALEDAKKMTEEEKSKAAQQKAQMEAQFAELEQNSRSLLDALESERKEKAALHKTVEMQNMTLSEMRRHLEQVKKDLESANSDKMRRERELEEQHRKALEDQKVIEKLKEQSAAEEKKRRELHNIIQEIKGNIRVYIRIRPSLRTNDDGSSMYEKVLGSDDRGLTVVAPAEESATGRGTVNKKWTFEFDRVFWPTATQTEVFTEISQLVQSALDGYKVCIFAYGQTSSGKTFTMEGPEKITPETRGMIPRSVEQLFNYREEMKAKGWVYEFSVSYLEIYNTTIRDLLQDEGEDVAENKHEIKLVKQGKEMVTAVDNLTLVPVGSTEELQPVLAKARTNRSSAKTASNERSSRSHSVFTLRMHGAHVESGQETNGILNLIDLAGSERVDKSQVTGDRLKETMAINSSLTCLGDVIAALAQNAKHVPFRNSKLTYLLQDCFGGGSKTLMFINVAPELSYIGESLCSLRFGDKVHACHIGVGKKQVNKLDETKEAAAGVKKPAATATPKAAAAAPKKR